MKYKVGDKVRIKSLEWYKANRDTSGDIAIGDTFFRDFMSQFCGSVVTIEDITLIANLICYRIKEDGGRYVWIDEMIEGAVEPELTAPTIMDGSIFLDKWFKVEQEIVCPEDYEFFDEMGNIIETQRVFIRKKKKEFPKTYEDCCEVLNTTPQERCQFDFEPYGGELYNLHRLLICRDAYWKIAGEEMGLGKPWKPDWNTSEPKYVIACTSNGIEKQWEMTYRKCFAFPTEEMRDAFKDNFDPDIEICKELL